MDWEQAADKIVEIAQRVNSVRELAREADIARTTLRDWMEREGLGSLDDVRNLSDKSQGAPPPAQTGLEAWKSEHRELTWREMVEHARAGAELQREFRPNMRRVARRIITDKPIFMVSAADFHLGSSHTDYDAFINTSDLLFSDERFYLAIAGADQETAFAWFRSAEAVLDQVLPPAMQIDLFKKWLDEIITRTLCVCGDNHTDERLERVLGDIGSVWRSDVPYFKTQGLLTLEIGPDADHLARYEVMLAHRYRGTAAYHDLQPALKMLHTLYPLADIYVTAHTHEPAYMNGCFFPEARAGKPRQHLAVCGTFKTGDDLYAQRNYGASGVLGLPTFMLWPGEYRVQHFDSPDAAVAATTAF